MTHSIGTGTRNLSFNVPTDEYEMWIKNAGDKGIGAMFRRLLVAGIESENPEAAQRLKEIRRRYYGNIVGLFAMVVITAASFSPNAPEMRRPRARVTVIRREVV